MHGCAVAQAAGTRCWRPEVSLRPLIEAEIRSLASLRSSLRSESTGGLVTRLTGVGKQYNVAVCQKLLTLGLLTSTSNAPEPLVLMRD